MYEFHHVQSDHQDQRFIFSVARGSPADHGGVLRQPVPRLNVNTASHDTMMQSCSNNLFQINSSVSYGILEFTGINIDKQLGKDKLCDFGCRSVFSDPRRLLSRRSACFRVSWPLCCD
jgi:hypothetical protein